MQLKHDAHFEGGDPNEPIGVSFSFTMVKDVWNRLLRFKRESNIPTMSGAAGRLLIQMLETLPSAPGDLEL